MYLGANLLWSRACVCLLSPVSWHYGTLQVLPPPRGPHSAAIRPALIWFSSESLVFGDAVTDACGEHGSRWAQGTPRRQCDTICTYRWQSARFPHVHLLPVVPVRCHGLAPKGTHVFTSRGMPQVNECWQHSCDFIHDTKPGRGGVGGRGLTKCVSSFTFTKTK